MNVPTRDPAAALTLQLLEWILAQPRTYAEVLEVWRTTCPRLTIWEDACSDGLIDYNPQRSRLVGVSEQGLRLLREASGDAAVDRGHATQADPRR